MGFSRVMPRLDMSKFLALALVSITCLSCITASTDDSSDDSNIDVLLTRDRLRGGRRGSRDEDASVSVSEEDVAGTPPRERKHRRIREPSRFAPKRIVPGSGSGPVSLDFHDFEGVKIPDFLNLDSPQLTKLVEEFSPKSIIDYGNWCGPNHGGYADCCGGKPCPSCTKGLPSLSKQCLSECPPTDSMDMACARHDTCVLRHKTTGEIHSKCSGNYCACDCALSQAADAHKCRDLHCHIYRQGILDIFRDAIHCWYYKSDGPNSVRTPTCNWRKEENGQIDRYPVSQFCDVKGRLECMPHGPCYDELFSGDRTERDAVYPHSVEPLRSEHGCECRLRNCIGDHVGRPDGHCTVVPGTCRKDLLKDFPDHREPEEDGCVTDPCSGMECPRGARCHPAKSMDGMICRITCRKGYKHTPSSPSPCTRE